MTDISDCSSQVVYSCYKVACLLICNYFYAALFPWPQYEDALDSPLEQCISDSMMRNKDQSLPTLGGTLFSLVPSGIPKSISEDSSEPLPISSPDSFSDFFKVIGKFVGAGPCIN